MKKFSVVLAAVALLGFLLAWNPGYSEAAVKVPSAAQDPAQLATASVLPVKLSSVTDAILLLYRQSGTETYSGSAGNVKLTFYTSACAKGTDVTINLSPSDVDLGDTSRPFVKSLFNVSASGVILGVPEYPLSWDIRWGMSGIVVDNDILAIYERQGYPAVVSQDTSTPQSYSRWAGFSAQRFEDFYIQGSGFNTWVQLVCPESTLGSDMNSIAPITYTTSADAEINVYGIDESFINSIHNVSCSCFTENPGSIKTYFANNTSYIGTFYITMSGQDATGSRVIVVTSSTGAFTGLYMDGRIRRSTGTALSN